MQITTVVGGEYRSGSSGFAHAKQDVDQPPHIERPGTALFLMQAKIVELRVRPVKPVHRQHRRRYRHRVECGHDPARRVRLPHSGWPDQADDDGPIGRCGTRHNRPHHRIRRRQVSRHDYQ